MGILLLLGIVALLLGEPVGTSSHSLRYFYTMFWEPGQGQPRFIIVGYVDDQIFTRYDSKTRRQEPQVPWMERVTEHHPMYWEEETEIARDNEVFFHESLEIAKYRYNHSGGLHTWQEMYGCELSGDGSKGGYRQYGYDGRDYLSFDKETLTWTAADATGQSSKRHWDGDWNRNQYVKAYLEEECIEWLRRYLDYGNKTLLRTEQPTLRVTRGAAPDGMETLHCRADGFYPKEIEIAWTRDGEVWTQDTFRGFVAPNADGTYHVWISAKIDPQERDHYRCRVGHDSLPDRVEVAWEEPRMPTLLIVGGGVGGLVVLAAAVIGGIYLYTSDRSSDGSARAVSDRSSGSSWGDKSDPGRESPSRARRQKEEFTSTDFRPALL